MSENILERIKGDLLEQIMNCIMPLLDKQTTVIFTGGKADAEGLLKIIDGLLTTKAKIVLSEGFEGIAPQGFKASLADRLLTDYSAMQKHISASKLVVVPILTRNTLAKAAVGIQDNLATCGIAGALMRAIPVIAVKDNCDPNGSHFKERGLDKNPAYNEMLEGHERTLVSFGVKLVESGEFTQALETGLYGDIYRAVSVLSPSESAPKQDSIEPAAAVAANVTAQPAQPAQNASIGRAVRLTDSFITCEDLMSLPSGASVEVGRNAVLTPLAKEYIERRGITVIFS
ncbi:MAG: flavoprotein [Synergistaceae bacterium]|jgi:hypothetical protein|nr:flavoprotein [Synergistaceae bacterium]